MPDKIESHQSTLPRASLLSLIPNFADLRHRADLGFAVFVIGIIVILILPMPSFMLDVLLAISIVFSVMILMTVLFIHTPLEFSSFPSVLLIAAMLRLALNLASTRLILADGHNGTGAAGSVIEAFGSFVTGGNYVIGVIVFAILIIVNFIVITKGSGRIAEVAARFTLDAMPGKQMAIDADLAAGLINEEQARERRKNLEDESSFFGAMDGASKFVRGDAIAGLLITFINVIGGIIIGVAQNDLSFADAGRTYALLTIGDGLVSQIPALIVSTAAGLLVSKAGVKGAADKALLAQFSGYPQVLGMAALVMIILSILPGMPFFIFAPIAFLAGLSALMISRDQQEKKAKTVAETITQAAEEVDEDDSSTLAASLKIEDLQIFVGANLVQLIKTDGDEEGFTQQIVAIRRQLALETGFIMPSVRITDNVALGTNEYEIKIREISSGKGEIYPSRMMVMASQNEPIKIPGIRSQDPAFHVPVVWIEQGDMEKAELAGHTIVSPSLVVSTHLSEAVKRTMADLLTYGQVKQLIDNLPESQMKLVDDIVPSLISMSGIHRVLQMLLSEQVSIRDLGTILEAIAEVAATSSTIHDIVEAVRTRLSRQLSEQAKNPNGYIGMVSLSAEWEKVFHESMIEMDGEQQFALEPSRIQAFVEKAKSVLDQTIEQNEMAAIVTSPKQRSYIRTIIERFSPQTMVLSHREIHKSSQIKNVGSI